ncbi:MAG TPA: ribonuclease III [bacterium]|nr:ribonuclease III [bacterium]
MDVPARPLATAPPGLSAGGPAPFTPEREALLSELEEKLNIKFRDRSLLHLALVHGSAGPEGRSRHGENYERLEFLGDSVLNLAISDHLYRMFPTRLEGDLARLRAGIVSEPALARVARGLDLGRYVVLGRGEEKGGGRSRPALLADALEAVLGAVYVDSGYGVAHYCVTRWFGDELSRLEEPGEGDYKSQLQELVQQLERRLPRYRITGQRGPEHDRAFVAIVEVNGRVLGEGRGRSKKEAEQVAAQRALETLRRSRAG